MIPSAPETTNEINYDQKIKSSNFNSKTEILIFGYLLDPSLENPIERDENATLIIYQYREKMIDIEIYSNFGYFRYNNLFLDTELINNSIESRFKRFEVESIFYGFFMEALIMNNIVHINIAFEEKGCQLSFDGIKYGNFLEFHNDENSIKPTNEELNTIKQIKYSLKEKQLNGVKIYKNQTSRESRGISITKYGIAHDLYDLDDDYFIDNPSYLRMLPDDYWEPYSSINIGIWRFMPSESQVKSDLQFYNKDYFQNGQGYIRDILAYNILTEDYPIPYGNPEGPFWEVYQWQCWFWIWGQKIVSIIYPNEIYGLWYYSYNPSTGVEIDVHPYNSLIFAHTCHGWSYGLDDPRGPTMAHAFCDYGAGAFVGSHAPTYAWCENTLPDPARIIFWNSLCQQNDKVEKALDDYCAFLSQIFGYNQRPEWHIMGNSELTI